MARIRWSIFAACIAVAQLLAWDSFAEDCLDNVLVEPRKVSLPATGGSFRYSTAYDATKCAIPSQNYWGAPGSFSYSDTSSGYDPFPILKASSVLNFGPNPGGPFVYEHIYNVASYLGPYNRYYNTLLVVAGSPTYNGAFNLPTANTAFGQGCGPNSSLWADELLAGIPNKTIKARGCALASLTSALGYAGAAQGSQFVAGGGGYPFNPGTLNAIINQSEGYNEEGDMKFDRATAAASDGALCFKWASGLRKTDDPQGRFAALDLALSDGFPWSWAFSGQDRPLTLKIRNRDTMLWSTDVPQTVAIRSLIPETAPTLRLVKLIPMGSRSEVRCAPFLTAIADGPRI